MDSFALQAANRLVGNAPGDAAIEITAGGAAFRVVSHAAVAVSLAGADWRPSLNRRAIPMWTAWVARPGDMLEMPGPRGGWGARAYLAVGGGIDVPMVLGSRSTDLAGGFGGNQGRALQAGDVLAAYPPAAQPERWAGRRYRDEARPNYSSGPVVRVVPGPHLDLVDCVALFGQTWRVGPQSNRMGYRIEGASAPHTQPHSLPSFGVLPGSLQIPADGQPILLMADAQTTGGYPAAGVVIQADLPLCAQLLPGDSLRFVEAGLEEAVAARREQWFRLERGIEQPDDEGEGEALMWAGALS